MLIETAMYRTLLATCGSAEIQMFVPIVYAYYLFHFRGAARCKQRAVHSRYSLGLGNEVPDETFGRSRPKLAS